MTRILGYRQGDGGGGQIIKRGKHERYELICEREEKWGICKKKKG
jgi:hypothetical protein